MNMENETKRRGRPFKMQAWLEELKIVLNERNILFLTDKDLQFLVNQRLSQEAQITDRTFENWKAGKFAPDDETGKQFMDTVHDALIRQKEALGKELLEGDPKRFKAITFLLERKFSEWNLKKISENITRQEQSLTLNITAANESQLTLIDSIINSDFTIVEPLKLKPSTSNNESEEYGF